MRNINRRIHRCILTGILLLLIVPNHSSFAHGPIQTESVAIDITTFPPAEQDIQALANYGNTTRIAGQRLVERGYDALNQLHAALLDPNATFQQKMQLITVLGEIGDAESMEHIIDIAQDSPNSRYLYQNTLLALTTTETPCLPQCYVVALLKIFTYHLIRFAFFETPRLALSQIEHFHRFNLWIF